MYIANLTPPKSAKNPRAIIGKLKINERNFINIKARPAIAHINIKILPLQ